MLEYHDVQRIQNLMFEYARCVDQREHTRLGELFEHGVIRSNKGEAGCLSGPREIRDAYDRNNKVAPGGGAATKHLITNILLDPVQDRQSLVVVDSYFSVFQAVASFPLQPIVMGSYRDSFELVEGVWCFREKYIAVDLIGNLEMHLNIAL